MISVLFILSAIGFWPWFADPWIAPKWVCLFLFSLAFGFGKLEFPKFPKLIVLATIACLLPAIVKTSPFPLLSALAPWMLFALLVSVGYSRFQNGEEFLTSVSSVNLISTTVVIFIAVLQLAGLLPNGTFADSTFGYPNIAAEYIGLSILIQWHDRKEGHFPRVILFLSYLYLFYLGSRAVWLGTLVSTFVLFFSKRTISKWALVGSLVLILGTGVAFLKKSPVSGPFALKEKQATLNLRLVRWFNTWELVKDHFFGIGPGRYAFVYPRYGETDTELRDNLIMDTPHNEALHFLAEYGWLPALLLFGFLTRFLLGLTGYPLGIFVYWLIVGLFAFPSQNPPVFLLLGLLTGAVLRQKKPLHFEIPKPATLFFALVIVYEALGVGFSNYADSRNWHDKDFLNRVCRAFPSRWETCLHKVRFDLNVGEELEAELEVQRILEREPENIYALFTLDKKKGPKPSSGPHLETD